MRTVPRRDEVFQAFDWLLIGGCTFSSGHLLLHSHCQVLSTSRKSSEYCPGNGICLKDAVGLLSRHPREYFLSLQNLLTLFPM